MRLFLLLIIFSLIIVPLSFPQSKRQKIERYSSYLKGLLYLEANQYSEGLDNLNKALALDPDSIHLRLRIATALIRLERIDEAEEILNEAKRLDPDNLDISLALIFVYSYSQRDAELEAEYERFLKHAYESKPEDVGISEYLAQFYFYKKKPQEAIKIYEAILEDDPKHIEAYFWLGYLYSDIENRDKAVDTWKKGLEIDPSFAPILNSLGYTYAQEGINLSQAESMIKKALEKEPNNGAYLDSLGWIYFKKGNLKKAEEYLVKAVSLMRDPEIYEHLGDLYISLGDQAKGINYYKDGLLEFPDNKGLETKIKEYEK